MLSLGRRGKASDCKIGSKIYELVYCKETDYENPNRESCGDHCAFSGNLHDMCNDNRCIQLKNRNKVWRETKGDAKCLKSIKESQ